MSSLRYLAWSVLSCMTVAASALHAAPVALRGATMIDVVAGRAVPNAVIVIDDGRILASGGRDTPIPKGATLVDLRGKYVIPGLIDSHTHYRPILGELYLNHGVTTALAMWRVRGGIDDSYWADSQLADARWPRLYGSVRVTFPHGARSTREEVREAVRRAVKPDTAFANVEDYLGPNRQTYGWAAEDLHDAGLMVYGHTRNAAASIALGQDVVEHAWGYSGSLMTPAETDAYRRGEALHWAAWLGGTDKAGISRLIADSVRRGVYLNPTMVYSFGALSSHAAEYEGLMRRLYADGALMSYYPHNLADGLLLRIRSLWVTASRLGGYVPVDALSSQDAAALRRDNALLGSFVHDYVAAGGKIVAGTDDPYIGTAGLSIHLEMAMLVEAGLTPMEALKAATIWGAEVMTARRKTPTVPPVGHLRAGALADLVVLGADPLANIDNTRRIERVMKGGSFIRLGYTKGYAPTPPEEIKAIPSIPEPEIASISPSAVKEDGGAFTLSVEGNGFFRDSVVRIDGLSMATTFVSTRRLTASVPASVAAPGQRNRFKVAEVGIDPGASGDHSARVTVFNHEPDGGESNPAMLRVQEPWVTSGK